MSARLSAAPILAGIFSLALSAPAPAQQTAPITTPPVDVTAPPVSSLTVPSVDEARETIQRIPGGVNLVPAEQFRDGGVLNLKDALGFTPGVYVQPRYQEEVRLSVRGSGLYNNNHLSGLRLLQDGIPLNLADGSGDFQEVDPLVIRYIEVYRGANGLQYGSSFLGGAVNLVSPTGYDANVAQARAEYGSYDYSHYQVSSGMKVGPWDYYASPTVALGGGFRRESDQKAERFASNVGYRFGNDAETRFYYFANRVEQRVPGSLTRAQAFADPRQPNPANVPARAARNVYSDRFANKTNFTVGDTEVMTAVYATDRELYHPLSFALLNQFTNDYGGLVRTSTEGTLLGHRNRLIIGTNLALGFNDAKQYQNIAGGRGALQRFSTQRATNLELFAENNFYMTQTVALVTGAQAVQARRSAEDRFTPGGPDTGDKTFRAVNPKLGLLWEVSPAAQVFGNVSRSFEPPRFSDLNPSAALSFVGLDAQKATTAEIGTRGRLNDVGFDVAVYRSWVDKELQLFSFGTGQTLTTNADKTIHQGIELGLDVPVAEAIFARPGVGTDSVRWRQIYNYSDFHFDGDRSFGNNRLPVMPRHYVRGELRYDNGEGAYVAPNVEWVPEAFYVDNANTTKSNTYVLFGVKSGYRVTPEFAIWPQSCRQDLYRRCWNRDQGHADLGVVQSRHRPHGDRGL
jgi:iron complex outermembrane receptor protein